MPSAFVLIQTEIELARVEEVVITLRKLDGIRSAYLVSGPYDIILRVEGETPEEISSLVGDKINFVPGVYRTTTCLVIQSQINR